MKDVSYTIHRANITEHCIIPSWFPLGTEVFEFLLSLDVGVYAASCTASRECETILIRVEWPENFVRDLLDAESDSLDEFETACLNDSEICYIAYYTNLPIAYQGNWTYDTEETQDLLSEIVDYHKQNGF